MVLGIGCLGYFCWFWVHLVSMSLITSAGSLLALLRWVLVFLVIQVPLFLSLSLLSPDLPLLSNSGSAHRFLILVERVVFVSVSLLIEADEKRTDLKLVLVWYCTYSSSFLCLSDS